MPADAKHTSALRLSFGADLEREFELHAADKRLHKIRITLCLAMLLALGFGMLDAGNTNSVSGGFWANGSVLLIMVLLGAALAVTHLRAGLVRYCKVAEVLAISLGNAISKSGWEWSRIPSMDGSEPPKLGPCVGGSMRWTRTRRRLFPQITSA